MTRPTDRDRIDELLSTLPRTAVPPPGLEDRVVAALADRGLVRAIGPRRPARRLGWLAAAAACLVAGVCGWALRGLVEPAVPPAPPPPAEREYLLLLAEPAPLRTAKPRAELVDEYRGWAAGLAGRGRLVTAARLSGDGRLLASPAPGAAIAAADTAATANPVTGFFVIRAAGLAEAVEIARGCPHLAYGGEISVRPVARPGDGR
jgi:hypothetical protein